MKWMRILSCLVILAAVGLLCYQGIVTKELTSSNTVKCGIIILGCIGTIIKSGHPRSSASKKATYQATYTEFILNAFAYDSKPEKVFYSAVDDFQNERHSRALSKLETLRKECTQSADIYAVSVFTALSSSRLGAYQKAVDNYKTALAIRPNARLASNMGFCYQNMGMVPEAEAAYQQAIQIDKSNPLPYSNLSALYFQEGDYESALALAEESISLNAKQKEALSTAAICCALLGYDEKYQEYYRRAVAAGYDGKTIKSVIRQLDPEL